MTWAPASCKLWHPMAHCEGRSSGNLCCRKVLRRGTSVADIMNHLNLENNWKDWIMLYTKQNLNNPKGIEKKQKKTSSTKMFFFLDALWQHYIIHFNVYTEMLQIILYTAIMDHPNLSGKGWEVSSQAYLGFGTQQYMGAKCSLAKRIQ